MSEPVTIWTRNPTGTAYLHPDGYGPGRVLGTPVVDARRRAKHLTDAECAAMYWAADREELLLEPVGTVEQCLNAAIKTGILYRFATHEQAV